MSTPQLTPIAPPVRMMVSPLSGDIHPENDDCADRGCAPYTGPRPSVTDRLRIGHRRYRDLDAVTATLCAQLEGILDDLDASEQDHDVLDALVARLSEQARAAS